MLGIKAFDFKAFRISKSIKNIKATHHSQNPEKPFKLYTP